jgi:hypothetical protein
MPRYLLELALLANMLSTPVAAVGIYRNLRWGWLLGVFVAILSFMLYMAQETVGRTARASYRSASWHGAYSANRRVQDTVEVGTTSVTSPNHRRR